jgi:hypothetical protein
MKPPICSLISTFVAIREPIAFCSRRGLTSAADRSWCYSLVRGENWAVYPILLVEDDFWSIPLVIVLACLRRRTTPTALNLANSSSNWSPHSYLRLYVSPSDLIDSSTLPNGCRISFHSQSYKIMTPGFFEVVLARSFFGANLIPNMAANAEITLLHSTVHSRQLAMRCRSSA